MKKYFLLCTLFVLALSQNELTAQINLEKIWQKYDYLPDRVPGFKFMNDGQHYTQLKNNNVIKFDLISGERKEAILKANDIEADNFNGKISRYTFSEDEKYIMIESQRESIYRRSSKAFFFVYNRTTGVTTAVRPGNKVMYASLSPNGKDVAYVFENNIYIQSLEDNSTKQLTHDGKLNEIINGSADWVYEEEFSMSQAFSWSPDGMYLAYQKFDESEVPEFTMTNYRNELYPEYVTFKYPKVGEKNAIVSVHIYQLKNDKTLDVTFGPEEDFYIPRIKWPKSSERLFVYHMNRHQNHLKVFSVDTRSGKKTQIIDEKNKYYIDITDDIRFLEDGKGFIWSSEKSGYNHLYLMDMQGRELNALTEGKYDVTQFYGIDEKNGHIYYQSAEKSPLERQVYRAELDGSNKTAIANKAGTNNVQFSSTYDYYINTHSTINTPASYTVYNREGDIIRELEDNKALKKKQNKENVQDVEFFSFKTSEDVMLNGYMIKPPNMEENRSYPLFMYVYGGPGSQNVTDSWKGQNYWWFQMLAQHGYVVACVDNRGTGGRGQEFKKMTYLQLGKYETMDQIEAAQYLGNMSFIDKKRIGIFGWSYGGYMSSLCILKGSDVFKTAIAVAPVTNWRWYDTIYTERYMRTEEENEDGYEDNSPVNFTDRLKGNFLIVHGMGDDNVHFQHTVEMVNALVKSNKQFDTYFYPNRNHGIGGGNTRLHLYQKMTDFLKEKL